MAKLIKSITELKKYVSNDFVNEFSVIDTYLIFAEEQITARYLGQPLFDDMVSFYNNGTPGTDVKKLQLLSYIQAIVCNDAMAEYTPIGNVQLSETGIHIQSSDDKKAAFEWQVDKLIASFRKFSASKLESMLSFLEENSSDFTSWKSSDLFSQIVGHIVNKASDFNRYVNINNSRLRFIALLSDIANVERLYIIPAISQAYYDELIDQIKGGSLSDDNKTIVEMLRASVANYAMAEYGSRQKEDVSGYANFAAKYLKKTIEYLNANASDNKYATYYTSDCYTAPEEYKDGFFDNDIDNSIYVT